MPQIPRLGLAGISGIGQQSAAAQTMFSRAGRSATPRRSRGSTAAAKPRRKKKRAAGVARKAKSGGGKRKYNSAAWMAKIRKMRKK